MAEVLVLVDHLNKRPGNSCVRIVVNGKALANELYPAGAESGHNANAIEL